MKKDKKVVTTVISDYHKLDKEKERLKNLEREKKRIKLMSGDKKVEEEAKLKKDIAKEKVKVKQIQRKIKIDQMSPKQKEKYLQQDRLIERYSLYVHQKQAKNRCAYVQKLITLIRQSNTIKDKEDRIAKLKQVCDGLKEIVHKKET